MRTGVEGRNQSTSISERLTNSQNLINIQVSCVWVLRGFRTCYPKILNLGTLNILCWRSLIKWKKQEDCMPPFSLKQVIKPSYERRIPIPKRKEYFLYRQRDTSKNTNKQALLSFLQFTIFASYSLTSPIPSMTVCPLFIKPSIKYSGLFLWVFLYEGSCVT